MSSEQTTNTASAESQPGRAHLFVVAGLVALLFLVLGFVGFRWMQSDALATLKEFTGQAERDQAAQLEQWRAAYLGDDFKDGDGARTSTESVAHFRLNGGARLKLNPASVVRFKRHHDPGSVRVDVEVGSAEVQSGTGSVTIGSEFGELVLEANSSVTMRRDGAQLSVDVELGGILINDRQVRAGDQLLLELGGIIVDVPAAVAEPPAEPEPEETAEPEPKPLNAGDGVPNAELQVKAGASFVVHDPSPPTAIGFSFGGICEGPARLSSGGRVTEAQSEGRLRFERGNHSYEVRCLDQPDVVAAKGKVRVLRDAGTRKLPMFTPSANVITDGRTYTVLYQHRLPRVTVSWPTAPQADSYTLTVGGRTIETKSPSHTFSSLGQGKHTVSFSAATTPPRRSRTSSIDVRFDTQAPAARVSEPSLGFTPGESVEISGQAMPGWKVSVDGDPVELGKGNKFSIELEGKSAIPIQFSHPNRGTHYYLRRPTSAP